MSIRFARESDAEQILAIYAPFCLPDSRVSFEIAPPSLTEMMERIRSVSATFPWLVWEENSRVLGYACATEHKERVAYQWSTDLAIYCAPEAKGKGIAKDLCLTLFEMLRKLGYYNIYAGTTLPNQACENLLKSLGCEKIAVYEKVGFKAGEWLDVAWYGLALRSFDQSPQLPVSMAQIDSEQLLVEAEKRLAGRGEKLSHG